jgi:hypothetical protein
MGNQRTNNDLQNSNNITIAILPLTHYLIKEHVARMFYMDLHEYDKLSISTLRHALM